MNRDKAAVTAHFPGQGSARALGAQQNWVLVLHTLSQFLDELALLMSCWSAGSDLTYSQKYRE